MSSLTVPVTSEDHRLGPDNAPVVLVEYADYECSHCALAHLIVKQLKKHFDQQLQVVFRNFPLSQSHPHAKIAAETAEFSADYDRFWEMQDLIFENHGKLSREVLLELAGTLKLPIRDLEIAIEVEAHELKIKNDLLGGVRSGVNGTPTLFINGQRYKY